MYFHKRKCGSITLLRMLELVYYFHIILIPVIKQMVYETVVHNPLFACIYE